MAEPAANAFLNGTMVDDSEDLMLNEEEGNFDPLVFWCVNGFIFLMMVMVGLWCCFADKTTWILTARGQESDQVYQQSLREREERRKQAKIESPEKRTRKLVQSFRRHKVQMTVKEEDLVEPSKEFDLQDGVDVETGSAHNTGHLRLPSNGTLVSNCCAICLGVFDVGDSVVWSSNPNCKHAFHQECVLGWLVKMQPETPCPCCRQEFTDLVTVRKESKIIWNGDAFNIRSIGFY